MSPVCKSTNILPASGSGFRHIGPEAQTHSRNADIYGKSARANVRPWADESLSTGAGAFRNGTEAFTPLWDGPPLRPAFVAQLLGQLFPYADVPDARFASAYRTYNSLRGMRCAQIV